MEKVVVVGRGCVGATVLNNINMGGDVYSLVDEKRFARREEILFNSVPLNIKTITPSTPFTADIIINAVKNFSLTSTISLMTPFVGEDTLILPLQNGIESEEVLSSAFGKDKVIRSFIQKLSTHRDGNSVTSFSPGEIVFGEDDKALSPRIKRVAAFFDKTKQNYRVSDDIKHDQWVKFMTNTCFNTLTALMEYDYGTALSSSSFIRAVRVVAREVQMVAKEEGVILTQDDVEGMISLSLSLPPRGYSSMCDDVMSHRETENRWFCGSVSKMAKKREIKTPSCDLLYILLEAKSGR